MALIVNIEKTIGKFHLKTAFQVEPSEIFGLLGESGCGKTMTLKCIAGIETPDTGRIILNGRVLYDSKKRINLPPQKRKIGYLFQDYALFPNMTVAQNIGIVLHKKEKLDMYLKQFYLEGLEHHYPSMLSGGQKQRCALARMMASEPELLLLDEPFSAVDKTLKWNLELQILDVLDTMKKPVIFVSHNRDEIHHLCQNIGIMECGQMRDVGRKEEVFTHPQTAAAARMTGCENVFSIKNDTYTHVGIPNEAVWLVKNEQEAQIIGHIERIFYEEQETILVIRMKQNHRIFYYRMDEVEKEFRKGERIYLHVDPEKIWYLRSF